MFINNNDIHILCVTEHWLQKNQCLLNLNNHVIASCFSRENSIRGGSMIIINKNFKFKDRVDIVQLSVECITEMTCVETERIVILCVYRPPNSAFDSFLNIMEQALLKISHSNKIVTVAGDFNVNILESSPITTKFLSLFRSFNLKNVFLQPTRITNKTATCIDNVFTNVMPFNCSIISKLDSDHCGQFFCFEFNKEKSSNKFTSYIPITSKRIDLLKDAILKNKYVFYHNNSPNDMFNTVFETVDNAIKKVLIPKTVSKKNRLSFSEWATIGINVSRRRLYDLYEQKRYNFDPQFQLYVKKYSKIFKQVCVCAKSLTIRKKIVNSNNIVKTTWDIINKETCRTKKCVREIELEINGKVINDDLKIAEAFETFFSKIPFITTRDLNVSPNLANSLLKKYVPECMFSFKFNFITPEEIIRTFKSLHRKSTVDLWGHSVKILNNIIEIIALDLAIIFNDCIKSGVFPDLMKHSKIIPLFKSGSTSDPTNYRPISVLPIFSKVFEKIILNQLLEHFTKHNLLHNKQFGFSKGLSTIDAGVELLKQIYDGWENSNNALGIFCDLSKAFDCVHHEILLNKLHHYGVRNEALALLMSYLENRVQVININGKTSPGSKLSMGVPQGSILGPFLFLVYINDLPFFVGQQHQIILFADDTSLIFKVDRKKTDYDDVNNAISHVMYWFNTNNLLLNRKKTKCVRFVLPSVKYAEVKLNIDKENLDFVDSTLFLGITIDSKLHWGSHISYLANKLSSAAYAVKRVREITDIETARLVYFSYFHSVMSYGILLWGCASDIDVIFVLQKRVIRFIYNMRRTESLRTKFKEIGILTVSSQFILENILYVKKNINKFSKNLDIHSINIRNKNKIVTHFSRLSKVNKSFLCQSIRFFNTLPDDVIDLPYRKFKTFVKQKLSRKGYYKLQDFINDKEAWK